jgi:hypothetical protein
MGMKYSGGCHCGRVQYEVDMEIEQAVECNCSSCSKRGSLLAFTSADNFRLKSEAPLSEYQFGKKRVHYYFCPSCGVCSFAKGAAADGKMTVAINIRCLDGVDLSKIPVKHFDGKSI